MKRIICIGILTGALLPAIAFAQTTNSTSTVTNVSGTAVPAGQSEFGSATTPPSYVLLAPLPCIGTSNGTTCTNNGGGSSVTSISIQNYLLYLFKLLIALAVFLAVVVVIYGGFKYMTVEAVTGKQEARETIEHAVYGLLLALASYLILYTINPNFVNLSEVLVPKLNVATTTLNLNTSTTSISQAQQSQIGASNQATPNAGSAALSGQGGF